jgi:hypothetical protein
LRSRFERHGGGGSAGRASEGKDRKSYSREDDAGKANMAPAVAATWFRLISVPLFNDVADPNAFGRLDRRCHDLSASPGIFRAP